MSHNTPESFISNRSHSSVYACRLAVFSVLIMLPKGLKCLKWSVRFIEGVCSSFLSADVSSLLFQISLNSLTSRHFLEGIRLKTVILCLQYALLTHSLTQLLSKV